MRSLVPLLLGLGMVLFSPAVVFPDEVYLVQEGRPRARIVVAAGAPRTTRLAAVELQRYLEKISGARLPIGTKPDPAFPVTIYVGRSEFTDRLGIRPEKLNWGAYRILSGPDYLVLIGQDTEFTPIDPWPRNNNQWVSGQVHRAWDRITGAHWGNPMSQLRKYRAARLARWGNEYLTIWAFDERGSYNAVCGFLRRLGVRWYMPGPLGEVVPRRRTILLPKLDQTVRPDFAVRQINFRLGVHGPENAWWAMRLGLRHVYGLQLAHGMTTMTDRKEILQAHPEWFALYGGKRHNALEVGNNHLCFSNPELLQETVRYVRTLMDHYHFDVVSVMPPDGYVAMCQCRLCQGKDTPQRGPRGALSDYVWDFVNRVARQVRKTHPRKFVSCCAYGIYSLPPQRIEKLEPNVLVCIVGGRRPFANLPRQQEEVRRLRKAWLTKTHNPIIVFENYPMTARGFYLPAFVIDSLGRSINATKGISQGEDIWLSIWDEKAVGFNHFIVYFTARMYWGGKQQDIKALFDEYCRLFYGPAATEMKAFFRYCESHWQQMEKHKQPVEEALRLFDAARRKAPPGSVYARRIALVDQYLEGLRAKRQQLQQRRGPVPVVRLVGQARDIVIDGRLDEPYWRNCPPSATGSLRELQTGRRPTFGTMFQVGWHNNNLYVAIRCQERPGEPPRVGTRQNEDQALWYGDAVEVLLATESHSYYQIAVNPAGAVIDLDRGADRLAWFQWSSQAEVATKVAPDHWVVEMRIPVTPDENDPLHQVVGRAPTASLPWFINICRQRVREGGREFSAFVPTGRKTFHHEMKMAYLYRGRHQQFPYDSSVDDYVLARQAAQRLLRKGRYEEALERFLALSKRQGLTPFQRSDALEQAAACARRLRRWQQAEQLARQIPIPEVAKTAAMHNLLAQRKWRQVIELFGRERIDTWPFWQAGSAWAARGRAYAVLKRGPEAQRDLLRALPLVPDPRLREALWVQVAQNRERNLRDPAGALLAYRQVLKGLGQAGTAAQFQAIQGAARLLAQQRQFDAALALFDKVNFDRLQGFWRGSIPLTKAQVLQQAGRTQEARMLWHQVAEDARCLPRHRQEAQTRLKKLP